MASSSVGGRLSAFRDSWTEIGAPQSVLDAISGYKIPFVRQPPLSLPSPSSYTTLSNAEHIALVDEEVRSLLSKGAIEPAPLSEPGFFSKIFLVPKPVGWRPIINLKRLNKLFIDCPHFRMDTVKDVALLLRPGDWSASIDLKDAYFHIPIDRKWRRYLRFGWKGKLFQFKVLPFGLCTAPLLFTLVTKHLKKFLHARGIRSIWYLDDILIIGRSREECAAHVQTALSLLLRVGFLVNLPKSSLIPSQDFRFLGFMWDTVLGKRYIDEERRSSIVARAAAAAVAASMTCHRLQVLLGHLTSVVPAIPLVRLHSRFLQWDLNAVYKSEADARRVVTLSTEAVRDLSWIASLGPPQCQAPLWPLQIEDCHLVVETDASDLGWGIFFQGHLHRGRWTDFVDAPVHINAKELMTLHIFLQDFLPPLSSPCTLLWRTDSTTALSYVKNEGGTISRPLLLLTRDLLLLAHRLQIRILPSFVPSAENHLADAASRFRSPPDWHLPTATFDALCRRWGRPEIDLFASAASAQVRRFFAWGDAREAEAFDALAQVWRFRIAYAFPPPPILPRVIRKMESSTGTFLLVTPFWPSQKWFPALLRLPVVDVRRLPEDPPVVDLAPDPAPLPHLPLIAWKIIVASTDSPSLTRRSTSSWTVGEDLPQRDMTPSGVASGLTSIPDEFLSIPSILTS